MRKTGMHLVRFKDLRRDAMPAGAVACAGALIVAGSSIAASAQSKQPAVPDAQVESSVLQVLAKNPKLSNQQISSTTIYGVVTLSGHVVDEPTRALAEDVVARTAGVTRVVDELTLDGGPATATPNSQVSSATDPPPVTASTPAPDPQSGQENGEVLQSDGSYAPADPASSAGAAAQIPADAQVAPVERGAPQVPGQPAYDQGQQTTAQPAYSQPGPGPVGGQQAATYGQQGQYGQQAPYPQPDQYPQQGAYPQRQSPYPQPGQYGPPQGYSGAPAAYGGPGVEGQRAGVQVTVPPGTVLQLRVNQPIDSRHSPVGSAFSGVLVQDILVAGYVAIPRGATLQGTVVDASSAGALKGRAELGLQLTQLTLGGTIYPVSSNLWSQAGGDKAVRTVNSALGLGALGAIIGGVAGGGAGAAIGAGAGGAVGLGASAASGGGSVVVPPESLLTFHLNAPMQIATVSQAELNRLAYNAPTYGPPRMVRRYPAYYPYGPGYYPRYYRPYPY